MTNINNYAPYRAGTYPSFVSSENGCKHEAKIQAEKLFGSLWLMEEFFQKGAAHCAVIGLS